MHPRDHPQSMAHRPAASIYHHHLGQKLFWDTSECGYKDRDFGGLLSPSP